MIVNELINKALGQIARSVQSLVARSQRIEELLESQGTSGSVTVVGRADFDPTRLSAAAGNNTFASMGYAISANVASIVITNRTGGNLFYENDGTPASNANYAIRNRATIRIYGDSTVMANVNLFTSGGGNVDVIQEVPQ